jgi:hypothetical protein
VLSRFLLGRHQRLVTLLADWPPAERREFARLIWRFTVDIDRHLGNSTAERHPSPRWKLSAYPPTSEHRTQGTSI